MDKSIKKPKKQGPIRFGAIVPISVIIVLIGVYFSIFFDGHMRRALEYVGTQVHGAEVNIAYFNLSLLRASLEIRGIQVTDKEKPHRNIIQLGELKFKLLWDALLRAKVVIDEASVLDIQALTPRKKPGRVLPPPSPSDEKSSVVNEAQTAVLKQTQAQYSQNFLGDIATVLSGTDPKDQIKSLQGQLKSDARIKELEQEFKVKQEKWKARIKELPQSDELKAYEGRIKALKFDINKPAEFAASVKEADKIIKEVDAKVKLIEQTSKDLNGDANVYKTAFNDLEKMVDEDLKDLQKKFKIPSIDSKAFSQQLFMGMIEKRIAGFSKYIAIAREYMPPKKTEEQKAAEKQAQIVPRKRGDGQNIRFPVTTGYPLFWLKHAALSSELGQSEYSGNIKGEIKDLTSDPVYLKKPAIFTAKGDFPKQNIFGFDARLEMNHTTERAIERANISIGAFPLGEQKLSDSPEASLKISEAKGSTQLSAVLVDQQLKMEVQNRFESVKYDWEAKNKIVKEIVGNVLAGIPVITLNAGITGSFSDLDIHINSNLGEELANGFKAQIQAKINEAKAQLKSMIDEKIGGEKAKLKAEIDKATAGLKSTLDSKKQEVDKVVNDAKSQAKSEQGDSQKKKLENEGKKLLKGLFGN